MFAEIPQWLRNYVDAPFGSDEDTQLRVRPHWSLPYLPPPPSLPSLTHSLIAVVPFILLSCYSGSSSLLRTSVVLMSWSRGCSRWVQSKWSKAMSTISWHCSRNWTTDMGRWGYSNRSPLQLILFISCCRIIQPLKTSTEVLRRPLYEQYPALFVYALITIKVRAYNNGNFIALYGDGNHSCYNNCERVSSKTNTYH